MNSLSGMAFCGILISALFQFVVSFTYAQTPTGKEPMPLIVGSWKLNPQKSNLPNFPADRVEIRQYRLRPDGFLVGLLIQTDPQGGYHFLQFTAKSDGKEYPEYSDQIIADMIAAGRQTPRTYSETIVDDHVTNWVDKADGRVTSQGKKIISQDGKTLTVTVDGAPASQGRVYDRQ